MKQNEIYIHKFIAYIVNLDESSKILVKPLRVKKRLFTSLMVFLVMMDASASMGMAGAMLTIFNGGIFLIDGALIMMGRFRGMGRLLGTGGFGDMGSLGRPGRLWSTCCFRLEKMYVRIKSILQCLLYNNS